MLKKTSLMVVAATVALGGVTAEAVARDKIRIVGSSTVYPFATVVAERFGKGTKFQTPIIESTGSGGGLKLFCAGVGVNHPDITNASRRIKKSEFDNCQKNGVKAITEFKIGFDGIAIAASKAGPQFNITRRELFLALAKVVPEGNKDGGKLIPNPNKTWKDVNPALPATKIEVLGPPPTSGTRDSFNELAIESGCKTFKSLAAIKNTDKARYKAVCHGIREDGAYVEAGENDNLIVQKLDANKNAVGVFGFSFFDQNRDKLVAKQVDGVTPTFDAISSGKYPISRSMFFYVKKAHLGQIPGIKEYAAEFMATKASGKNGYLGDKGLVPMPAAEHKKFQQAVNSMPDLKM